MRGLLLATVIGCLGLTAAGCRRADLVEAELRTRERELRETRSELNRSEFFNQALQSELGDLRKSGQPGGFCSSNFLTPERASQIYTLKEITLGRLTGGYNEHDFPGDEALQVILEPRDPDGQSIKAPGQLTVTALMISSEGLKTPLSTWQITPDQLRRTWRSGLLSTGYFVVLPWKIWPTTSRMRVIAQFTLADGRVFEAEKDVTIRLPPNLRGPMPRQVPSHMPPADASDVSTTRPRGVIQEGPSMGETTMVWKKAVPR
jgi:hypothetical protein